MAEKLEFDPSLDETLYSGEYRDPGAFTKLEVSARSYDKGRPKLQILRLKTGRKGFYFPNTKLGRLTTPEIEGILPLIQEALKVMG